jgi:hypothetical protein
MKKKEYKDSREFKEDFIQKFLFEYCLQKGRYLLNKEFNEKYSNIISSLMGSIEVCIDSDPDLIEELFKAYCDESIDNVDPSYQSKYARIFNIFNGDLIKDLIKLYDYIRYSNHIVDIVSSYRPQGEVTLSELLDEYKITKSELAKFIYLDSHLESEIPYGGDEEIEELENKLKDKFTEEERVELARILFSQGKFTDKDKLHSIRPQELPEVREDKFGIEIPDSLESDVDELL